MKWFSNEWNWMELDGIEWNWMKLNGIGWNWIELNRNEHHFDCFLLFLNTLPCEWMRELGKHCFQHVSNFMDYAFTWLKQSNMTCFWINEIVAKRPLDSNNQSFNNNIVWNRMYTSIGNSLSTDGWLRWINSCWEPNSQTALCNEFIYFSS